MEPVNIHQAKTQRSQLLHVVEQGGRWQRPGRCADT